MTVKELLHSYGSFLEDVEIMVVNPYNHIVTSEVYHVNYENTEGDGVIFADRISDSSKDLPFPDDEDDNLPFGNYTMDCDDKLPLNLANCKVSSWYMVCAVQVTFAGNVDYLERLVIKLNVNDFLR